MPDATCAKCASSGIRSLLQRDTSHCAKCCSLAKPMGRRSGPELSVADLFRQGKTCANPADPENPERGCQRASAAEAVATPRRKPEESKVIENVALPMESPVSVIKKRKEGPSPPKGDATDFPGDLHVVVVAYVGLYSRQPGQSIEALPPATETAGAVVWLGPDDAEAAMDAASIETREMFKVVRPTVPSQAVPLDANLGAHPPVIPCRFNWIPLENGSVNRLVTC